MASSGWLGEQTLVTRSSNIRYVGDVRIDSITRNSDNVVISGAIRLGSRGTSGYSGYYNYGVQARPAGGSWQVILPGFESLANGNNKDISFTTTLAADSSATWATLTIDYKACYNSSCSSTYWTASPSWTVYFDQAVTPPSGLTVNPVYVSLLTPMIYWNRVHLNGSISSYGIPSDATGRYIEVGLNDNSSSLSGRRGASAVGVTSTVKQINNSSTAYDGGVEIKGMATLYPYIYASNTQASSVFIGSQITLPPAPSQITYTSDGGSPTTTYTFVFKGIAANNITGYTVANLLRYVRYKQTGDADWTYLANGLSTAVGNITTFNRALSAGESVVVEGWQTYNGQKSEVTSVTITNTNNPAVLYGGVNGEARQVQKLYGSVNGQTKEIKKLYGSVDGVAKLIYEAQ